MGVFLPFLATFALDAASALLNGPKPEHIVGLKDKSARSDAYGTDWSRGRGVVRLQGKVLWSTHIQTSLWKTVSGGLFGIGSKSVTYEKYSVSQFIGFGYKLGGGAAVDILRIWADGKLLFNKVTSTGHLSNAIVTVVAGKGGQQFILLDIASGGSLSLNAGDIIILGADPLPYTVQSAVSATGPATSVSVTIWPPTRQAFAGGGAAILSQQSVSPWDLSSFDPNPHDGSHTSGGYPCPPGGAAFYLGSAMQGADPTMVKHLGVGNVPGYRGLVALCLHDLQLANYGNHCPQITAEVAFDIGTPQFPFIGPIPGADVSPGGLFPDGVSLPFSGNEAIQWTNPFTQRLPFIWVLSQTGEDSTHDGTIYEINAQTHQLVGSVLVPRQGTFRFTGAGAAADNDGYLYFVQNNSIMSKYDGQTLTLVNTFTGFGANVTKLYCWDTAQSLFGNPVLIKLLASVDSAIHFFDRTVLLPLGIANSGGSMQVVVGYTAKSDGTAVPIITTGDWLNVGLGPASVTDDGQGNLWVLVGTNLTKIDMQFISFINPDPQNPFPEFLLPTFATMTIDVSSIGSGWVQWYGGDNTIVVATNGKAGKVDVATGTIVAGSIVTDAHISNTTVSQTYDPMGSVVMGGYYRLDLGSLQVTGGPYTLSNWVGPVFGGGPVYDPYTDSLWYSAVNNPSYPSFGSINQALLDRGIGSGFGLDAVLTSLFLEAGYQMSEFDVTSITSAGLTLGGWEFERKTYKESLQELMRHFLFDVAEIDGKIHCVARGQSSVVTIPEDDLGALDDPSKYEPRVTEILQDELDTPRKVTIKYYDPLKDDQQARQEAERIAQPYTSSLVGTKPNTNSLQQLDVVSPIFENALKIKQQADIILWDRWAGRFTYTIKLSQKYLAFDPTDVFTVNYKGLTLVMRCIEADFGAGFARQFKCVSQDASVYTSSVSSASSGTGSGVPGTPPVSNGTNYTINPAQPLSEVSNTDIHMVNVVATFTASSLRLLYNARDFTVPDPGGTPTLYYVTVYDPNLTGEVPGSTTLSAFCDPNPAVAHVGVTGYIFMGTITITHDLTGVIVTSGGSGSTAQAIGFYVNGGGGTPTPTGQTIDLLSYAVSSKRGSFHNHGFAANSQASNNYSWLDSANSRFAFIKASAGWAADGLAYDSQYIYQSITELDDVGHRDWSINTSFKKLVVSHGYPTPNALPIMPRYFTPGGPPFRIDIPAPNPYHRYVSCSVIDTIDKGPVTNITYGPIMMNFDNDIPGVTGNLGNILVMVNERYSGNSARERFYLGFDLSLVKWDAGTLVSGQRITGVYKIFNWSVHNQLTAGSASLSFGCGVSWP